MPSSRKRWRSPRRERYGSAASCVATFAARSEGGRRDVRRQDDANSAAAAAPTSVKTDASTASPVLPGAGLGALLRRRRARRRDLQLVRGRRTASHHAAGRDARAHQDSAPRPSEADSQGRAADRAVDADFSAGFVCRPRGQGVHAGSVQQAESGRRMDPLLREARGRRRTHVPGRTSPDEPLWRSAGPSRVASHGNAGHRSQGTQTRRRTVPLLSPERVGGLRVDRQRRRRLLDRLRQATDPPLRWWESRSVLSRRASALPARSPSRTAPNPPGGSRSPRRPRAST